MKTSNCFLIIILGLLLSMPAKSQFFDNEVDSTSLLFDSDGSFTKVTNDVEEITAKMVKVNPRLDDVIWRKAVLRVIDLRERQNNALYYPKEDIDSMGQKNLFSIMFLKVLEGKVTAYKSPTNPEQTFVPRFTKENIFDVDEFIQANSLASWEDNFGKINYVTPGVTKFYIQEVWYFNKATSTFHNKILSIAPVYDEHYNPRSDMRTGVFFWVPYDNLRPYLQEEFMKINGRNVAPLVNYDEFLISRQFDSYIIKDYDLISQDIDKNIENPDIIRREQQRVEDEILNFEQDLWHY